jgi:hypothetical protein
MTNTLDGEPIKKDPESFLTKQTFSKKVEELISRRGAGQQEVTDYMDAIIHLCGEHDLYIEDIKKYLSDPIKSKLKHEATLKNCLKREQNFTPLE